MSNKHDAKFKDDTPRHTVDRIKEKLKKMNIELREEWGPKNDLGTYSLRVSLKGTKVGSNGKGTTKDYAMASAYAEFMERFQNMKLQGGSVSHNLLRNTDSKFYLFCDEKILSSDELSKEKNSFIRYLLNKWNIDEANAKEIKEYLWHHQKMDYNLFQEHDKFLCLPYFSVSEKRTVYLPYFAMNLCYGSNGMCAGNTMEEAVVQGLSEIYERYVQKRFMKENTRFPNFPEEYLEKDTETYHMYSMIKNNPNMMVEIKDCSYGGKYPVAALVITKKNSGKFGVKMGSHPNMRIAIERLFTEATQGISIDDYAKKTVFDFQNRNVTTNTNIANSFKTGDGMFPHQIIMDGDEYVFSWPKDVSNETNKELMDECISDLIDDGYDVLIRDVSFLGFPSYHIIVPGFSEMNDVVDMSFEAENTRFHMQPIMWKPEMIDNSNIDIIISVFKYYLNSLAENSVADITGYLSNEEYPGKEYHMENYYYMAMCYMYKENYSEAVKNLLMIERYAEYRGMIIAPWYKAVRIYAEGMEVYNDHEMVLRNLDVLFDHEIVDKIGRIFRDRRNIFRMQYKSVVFDKSKESVQDLEKDTKGEFLLYKRLVEKYKKQQMQVSLEQETLKNCL
ncbi:MAG: YcaO-like family protein [Parasporobacterium sp.]|nr:YcaO-like family protein [Parasporobacterium sp.]